MKLKRNAKFRDKMTCGFNYYVKNLVNFHLTTQKSENFTLMRCFCPKHIMFELKKYRGVIFHDTEQWCKIWINPDLVVSKMTWGIGWTFIRVPNFTNSIAIKFQPKTCRRTISHGTEKRSKLSRKTDFLFEKWHEEFCEL